MNRRNKIKKKKTSKPAKKNAKAKRRAKGKMIERSKARKAANKKKTPHPREKKVLAEGKRTKPSTAKPADIFDGVHKTKIMVIGIGGGGGSIVSEIASRVKKAGFVIANTDLQALKESVPGIRLFQFGQDLTHGLGTGMNSELGRVAAQQESEKIKKIFEGQDLCVLISCLGGGTGSGAAPIFAKISKDLGILTYGIFTLPFGFEGEKKSQIAQEALGKLKAHVNTFSVIPNERIFQIIDKNTPLKAALSVINKNLAEGLEGLIEMIYDPGLINIDFADLRTIFEGKGKLTYLNTTEVSGPKKGEEILKNLISNPLCPYTIRGAKGILFNIAGEKTLTLDEVSQISRTISSLTHRDAKIIFGLSQENKYKNRMKVTLLATGCSPGNSISQKRERSREKSKDRKAMKKPALIETNQQKTAAAQESRANPSFLSAASKKIKLAMKNSKKSKQSLEKKENTATKEKQADFIQSLGKKQLEAKEKAFLSVQPEEKAEPRVRRNGLQIKKETQEIEQELLNQEKQWERPAFLRRQTGDNKKSYE